MKVLRFQLIILALSVSSIVGAQQILDSISFRYEDNSPIIDAEIEGQNYKFLFDTGNPLTRVFPEVLGWKTTEKSPQHQSIKRTEIKIGTYAQQVDVYPYRETQTCKDSLHGAIGYNFMKDKIWMLDYRKKKIYRLNVTPPANKALHIIPIFIIPGGGLWKELLAEIKINGKPYLVKFRERDTKALMKFDTGFSSKSGTTGLLLNKRFLVEECKIPDITYSIEVCGKQYEYLKPATVDLTINDSPTFSVEATGAEDVEQALLGNAFFERYRPVFDLINNQLLLFSSE
ncbi:MAG: hypothetical protein FWH39_02120 [Bacteroidales bacterium]|nr:hypothetical protein [Bacteroidales bacterium]